MNGQAWQQAQRVGIRDYATRGRAIAATDGHLLAYIDQRRSGGLEFVEDADAFIATEKLGPDVLDSQFNLGAFEQAFSGRKRDIKTPSLCGQAKHRQFQGGSAEMS